VFQRVRVLGSVRHIYHTDTKGITASGPDECWAEGLLPFRRLLALTLLGSMPVVAVISRTQSPGRLGQEGSGKEEFAMCVCWGSILRCNGPFSIAPRRETFLT
jgi:hypothetical protein